MQPTWTFTRNGGCLVLQRIDDAAPASLRITTPEGTRTVTFHDVSALTVFQADMEAMLVRTGWSLESFEPERRQDQERRLFPRENPDRRRWWTDGRRAAHEKNGAGLSVRGDWSRRGDRP